MAPLKPIPPCPPGYIRHCKASTGNREPTDFLQPIYVSISYIYKTQILIEALLYTYIIYICMTSANQSND